MTEQAFFTLGEAAKLTGKSKGTISNAIKTGKISVHDKKDGAYQIAASELFRVFPMVDDEQSSPAHSERSTTPSDEHLNTEAAILRERLKAMEAERDRLQEERERERRESGETIRDLRTRLDHAEKQRTDSETRLHALLEDHREKPKRKFLGLFG